MTKAERVVAAALSLEGTRFRLHGRRPDTGLDCVGVAAFALRAAGWVGDVPSGYALRGGDEAAVVAAFDRVLVRSEDRPGAVLLLRAGPGQLHLAVRTQDGVVHADASLRRVVARPGPLPWPVIGAWTTGEDKGRGEWQRWC